MAKLAEHGLRRVKKNAEEAYVVPKGIATIDTVRYMSVGWAL